MTLIVSLGNPEHVVLVADRRISRAGTAVGEESNKLGLLRCSDARMAFAYTGLAETGGFVTEQWLLEALVDAAKADSRFTQLALRFAELATEKFRALRIRPEDKRLSVVFVGYCDVFAPGPWYAIVSNFEDETLNEHSVAAAEFSVRVGPEDPAVRSPAFVLATGHHRSLLATDLDVLRGLVRRSGKPSEALVDKAVDAIRTAAMDKRSLNTVGKQCGSIVIPSTPSAAARFDYHSAHVGDTVFTPNFVDAVGGFTLMRPFVKVPGAGPRVAIEVPFEGPLSVITLPELGPQIIPKVGRNDPCPCRSGMKYKRCHGR